jgi:cell division septation protein DedD
MATAAPSNKTTLDQSVGSATADLYRAAIGTINTAHYLAAFERFEASELPGLRWNWAAALLTLNWLAFRSLWGAALAYTGAVAAAALLVFGIGRLVLGLSAQTQWAWLAVLALMVVAVPGLWGTAWFYTASRKRMAHALAVNDTVPEACAMLKRNAASRGRLIALALLNATLLAGAVAVYLNLPTAKHTLSPTPAVEIKTEGPVVDTPAAPLVAPVAVAVAPPAEAAASAPSPVASAPQVAASAPAKILAPAPEPIVETVAVIEPAKPVAATKASKVGKVVKANKATKTVKPAPETIQLPVATTALAPEKTFLVNAGLFANPANAQHVRTTLSDAGMVVIAEEVTGTKGTFTRVRVGPFASRELAVAAVLKIRSLGLEAQVLNPP